MGRDPVTLGYVANWSDEEDRHEDGGEFETVEDAIEWARARAPVVFVMLGFQRPVFSRLAKRYEPGEEPGTDPRPRWPPSRELLNDLLADRYVQTVDLGEVFIVGVDEDDEVK